MRPLCAKHKCYIADRVQRVLVIADIWLAAMDMNRGLSKYAINLSI